MTAKMRQAFLLPGRYAHSMVPRADAVARMDADASGIHCIVSFGHDIVSYVGPVGESDGQTPPPQLMIRAPKEVRFSNAPDTISVQELLERTSIQHRIMDCGKDSSLILVPEHELPLMRKLLQCTGVMLVGEEAVAAVE